LLRESKRLAVGSAPVRDAVLVELDGRPSAEVLLQRARERGFDEGLAAGSLRAANGAAARLDEASRVLEERADELRDAAARTSIELALVIARELVGHEIATGTQDLERIVRDVLSAAGAGRGACTVHLNPVDAAVLADVPFRSGTRIEADPGVRRGDVHVETALGVMVREVDDALATLSARLRQELR